LRGMRRYAPADGTSARSVTGDGRGRGADAPGPQPDRRDQHRCGPCDALGLWRRSPPDAPSAIVRRSMVSVRSDRRSGGERDCDAVGAATHAAPSVLSVRRACRGGPELEDGPGIDVPSVRAKNDGRRSPMSRRDLGNSRNRSPARSASSTWHSHLLISIGEISGPCSCWGLPRS
jgi:hypothetical protein